MEVNEKVRAFIEAYAAFVEARHNWRALGGFVAPAEHLVQERTNAYFAAASALDLAWKELQDDSNTQT